MNHLKMITNDCVVIRVETPEGTLYVNFIEDEAGQPFEVKIEIGKSGSTIRAWTEVTSRLISELLQAGKDVYDIIPIISNNTSDRIKRTKNNVLIRSGSDGVAYALYRYLDDKYPNIWNRRHSRLRRYE